LAGSCVNEFLRREKEMVKQLKVAMLEAKNINQLIALIIHHSHEEMMDAYEALPSEQQTRIKEIWEGKKLVSLVNR
jgi:hypothetical protein